MSDSRVVSDWCIELRAWIRTMPSGSVFRSRDVFRWVEAGGVLLTPADMKPIGKTDRPIWRHRLSRALSVMNYRGELVHPGMSSQAWRIP